MANRGVPLVVSAPSGAGKTTLCHELMQQLGGVEYSISHTTRPIRGEEKDGVDYHFVDDATFDDLIKEGAFLEWADVFGKRYGTTRAAVEEKLNAGIDVLFDIDVQGGQQIADKMSDAVLLFVLPPDFATLEQRLRGRGSDSEEQIQRRLVTAEEEIKAAESYRYLLVNDELRDAVARFRAILVTERLRRVVRRDVLDAFFAGGDAK